MLDITPRVKYSPRNKPTAREKGPEIIKARKEVRRVPIKNGSAPKLSDTGSQVVPYKKLKPIALIDGIEETIRVMKMHNKRMTTAAAESTKLFRNKVSEKLILMICLSLVGCIELPPQGRIRF
jgi:hypothetical protein